MKTTTKKAAGWKKAEKPSKKQDDKKPLLLQNNKGGAAQRGGARGTESTPKTTTVTGTSQADELQKQQAAEKDAANIENKVNSGATPEKVENAHQEEKGWWGKVKGWFKGGGAGRVWKRVYNVAKACGLSTGLDIIDAIYQIYQGGVPKWGTFFKTIGYGLKEGVTGFFKNIIANVLKMGAKVLNLVLPEDCQLDSLDLKSIVKFLINFVKVGPVVDLIRAIYDAKPGSIKDVFLIVLQAIGSSLISRVKPANLVQGILGGIGSLFSMLVFNNPIVKMVTKYLGKGASLVGGLVNCAAAACDGSVDVIADALEGALCEIPALICEIAIDCTNPGFIETIQGAIETARTFVTVDGLLEKFNVQEILEKKTGLDKVREKVDGVREKIDDKVGEVKGKIDGKLGNGSSDLVLDFAGEAFGDVVSTDVDLDHDDMTDAGERLANNKKVATNYKTKAIENVNKKYNTVPKEPEKVEKPAKPSIFSKTTKAESDAYNKKRAEYDKYKAEKKAYEKYLKEIEKEAEKLAKADKSSGHKSFVKSMGEKYKDDDLVKAIAGTDLEFEKAEKKAKELSEDGYSVTVIKAGEDLPEITTDKIPEAMRPYDKFSFAAGKAHLLTYVVTNPAGDKIYRSPSADKAEEAIKEAQGYHPGVGASILSQFLGVDAHDLVAKEGETRTKGQAFKDGAKAFLNDVTKHEEE